MVPSSSSASIAAPSSLRLQHHRSPHFTPIREGEKDELEEDDGGTEEAPPKHHPTPIHGSTRNEKHHAGKSTPKPGADPSEDDRTVSCNNCRPSAREKISVVPLDNSGGDHRPASLAASPNGIFRSFLTALKKKSPRPFPDSSASSTAMGDEQWKAAVAELSHKLSQTTRKRDEAILEASRLKYSMGELERKLNKLEIYCHNLKYGLDACNGSNSPYHRRNPPPDRIKNPNNSKVTEHFLVSVSEARTSVRLLSRALALQIRQIGGRIQDAKFSPKQAPVGSVIHLESVLNRTLFEDFETAGFPKRSSHQILNPFERCEANYRSFQALKGLAWEEVLSKGTKHFSEEFSGFCDRKMSEIVGAVGWSRAWPEPLLQAFFGASKSVWLVHLLAASVHPAVTIFRVASGSGFDPAYMEGVGGPESGRRQAPTAVRAMVAPGFYVEDSVVKCKVVCRHHSEERKGLGLSPVPDGL